MLTGSCSWYSKLSLCKVVCNSPQYFPSSENYWNAMDRNHMILWVWYSGFIYIITNWYEMDYIAQFFVWLVYSYVNEWKYLYGTFLLSCILCQWTHCMPMDICFFHKWYLTQWKYKKFYNWSKMNQSHYGCNLISLCKNHPKWASALFSWS